MRESSESFAMMMYCIINSQALHSMESLDGRVALIYDWTVLFGQSCFDLYTVLLMNECV